MKTKTYLFIFIAWIAVLLAPSCSDGNSGLQRAARADYLFAKSETGGTEGEKYLDSIERFLAGAPNDSATRGYLYRLSGKRYAAGQMEKYLDLTRRAYRFSIEGADTVQAAKGLYFIGDYFEQAAVPDSALYYYGAAEKLYAFQHDSVNIGKMKLYKGGILFDTGNYDDSESQAVLALRLLSGNESRRLEYECFNLIALSLKEMNDFSNSLKYFGRALETLDALGAAGYPSEKVGYSRASCYNNIGLVQAKMGNYSAAQEYYRKAMQSPGLRANRKKLYAMLLHNLGMAKLKTSKTADAKALLLESLQIRADEHNEPGIISSKIGLGEYYLRMRDTAQALLNLKESYERARKIKSNDDILTSLQLLAANDSKQKEFYTGLFFHVSDSLKSTDREKRNRLARIAFETDEMREQNEVLVKTNAYILAFSAVILAFAFSAGLIFRLRAKNRKLVYERGQQHSDHLIYRLLLEQQDERARARDGERHRIAMELHDGIINRIFTTRFALMQLRSGEEASRDRLVAELQKTEEDIRQFSRDLAVASQVLDSSLDSILRELVAGQQNEWGTRFDFTSDPLIEWPGLGGVEQIQVYRIVQEALQNVNRYAAATLCCVLLMRREERTIVRIWDNGLGFDTAKSRKGLGISNMTERAAKAGATLHIVSAPGKGTTVELLF